MCVHVQHCVFVLKTGHGDLNLGPHASTIGLLSTEPPASPKVVSKDSAIWIILVGCGRAASFTPVKIFLILL